MLRAILFDFNGVILNDEPIHLSSMQSALRLIGIELTEEAYWREYHPLDDIRCLEKACLIHGVSLPEEQQRHVLDEKVRLYLESMNGRFPLFPGAPELVRAAAARYPLAIASAARREEIVGALEATGLGRCFRTVVACEDFVTGKPHPDSYLFALSRLNAALNGGHRAIEPAECVVIEDSTGGVEGVRAAGMVCVAVTNTHSREKLAAAHRVVDSLEELRTGDLERLVEGGV
jgi:beta-phosphoglucomutase